MKPDEECRGFLKHQASPYTSTRCYAGDKRLVYGADGSVHGHRHQKNSTSRFFVWEDPLIKTSDEPTGAVLENAFQPSTTERKKEKAGQTVCDSTAVSMRVSVWYDGGLYAGL